MSTTEFRHIEILRILEVQERATVQELSEIFEVSQVTVRNDLNILANQGKVQRVHGGAIIIRPQMDHEFTFATRQRLHADRKNKIGELATSVLAPRDFVLIDASTTALAVGRAIKTKFEGNNGNRAETNELTIVATGLWTAVELMGVQGINVVVAGGNLRNTTGSLVGPLTRDFLRKINIRRAFLGAWGVTLEEGITDTNLLEVELKQMIIQLVDEVIVVVDGSKFGEVGLSSFARVDEVSHIITDSSAPTEMIEAIRARGVQVLIAE